MHQRSVRPRHHTDVTGRRLSSPGQVLAGSEPNKVTEPTALVALVVKPSCTRLPSQRGERHHVWIRLALTDDEPPAGLQHPSQLTQRPVPVRNFAEGSNEERGVERRIRKWHPLRVPLHGDHIAQSSCTGAAHHLVEHRLLQIESVDLTSRLEVTSYLEGVVAGAWPYLQDSLAWLRAEKAQESVSPQEWAWHVQEDALTKGTG